MVLPTPRLLAALALLVSVVVLAVVTWGWRQAVTFTVPPAVIGLFVVLMYLQMKG